MCKELAVPDNVGRGVATPGVSATRTTGGVRRHQEAIAGHGRHQEAIAGIRRP